MPGVKKVPSPDVCFHLCQPIRKPFHLCRSSQIVCQQLEKPLSPVHQVRNFSTHAVHLQIDTSRLGSPSVSVVHLHIDASSGESLAPPSFIPLSMPGIKELEP